MAFTLQQAANAVGKHKSTVFKAIKNGNLSAEKDDKGNYRIEESELYRVYPIQQVNVEKEQLATANSLDATQAMRIENAVMKVEIEKLRDLIELKDKNIKFLEETVASWQDEAKASRRLLEHHSSQERGKKKGIFAKIFA